MATSPVDKRRKQNVPFPGRKGDPRMNRAVEAREADPQMPLLDALLKGGFVFPDIDSADDPKKLRDTDGVSLFQRKNQLLRRLRAIKETKSNTSISKNQEQVSAVPFLLSTTNESSAMTALQESRNDVENEQFDVLSIENEVFDEMIYPQHEKTEHFSLSEKEKDEIHGDLFGKAEILGACFSVAADELHDFDEALNEIDAAKKLALVEAQKMCPSLVGNKQKEMFLRWADHDVKQAVDKFVMYWNVRRLLFGSKAFLPLTLDHISDKNEVAFQARSPSTLPLKDEHGRALIWVDPSRLDFAIQKRESEIRYWWCIIHSMLEDEQVQRNGFVILVYGQHTHVLKNFDRKYQKMLWSSFNVHLPMKLKALHFIRAPPFVNLVLPVMKFFCGREMRHRVRFHSGTNQEILESLLTYGIPQDSLPNEIGGSIEISSRI